MSKNKTAPIVILSASKQPFLSVGIYYGGIKTNGKSYIYLRQEDAFIQDSYVRDYKDFVIKNKKSWEDFLLHIEGIKNNQI